ncbi:hypothetical protein [Loigolactobacillus zhaoyuanensis]|uniref:DUF4868 domain-containing protein n=1 Tax=Loigolactobacillus zhaoyuanensis TaxID=2486017 RepID=A0ABW8UFX2_9LACO|nr:hypothetical protein [Loigolactobacillus zhaoyuanensis]
MNSILIDLETAQQQHLLINIYQETQEVVYTGYVTTVNDTAVVMDTYDDGGLRDGAVYLGLTMISEVELAGQDLTNMAFRIKNAQLEQFIKLTPQPLSLNDKFALLPQILQTGLNQQYFMLLILTNGETFLEGIIAKVTTDTVTVNVFDKFDFSSQRTVTIALNDIQIVELQGKELTLVGKFMREVPAKQHLESVDFTVPTVIEQQLRLAQKGHELLLIYTSNDDDNFFVGTVNTLNQTSVLFNLIDMNGQFGGYVLLKLTEIQRLTTSADYLQLMNFFIKVNQQRHFMKQPVLNDERLFDGTTDLFASLIQQARVFARVIRLRLRNDVATFTGVPLRFDGDLVTMRIITSTEVDDDDGDFEVEDQVSFSLDNVGELAFDYLDAYLTERQIKENGDL